MQIEYRGKQKFLDLCQQLILICRNYHQCVGGLVSNLTFWQWPHLPARRREGISFLRTKVDPFLCVAACLRHLQDTLESLIHNAHSWNSMFRFCHPLFGFPVILWNICWIPQRLMICVFLKNYQDLYNGISRSIIFDCTAWPSVLLNNSRKLFSSPLSRMPPKISIDGNQRNVRS